MPQVACNQDICLCLGLKSTEAISLLRVKKKSRHCSSSLRQQQHFFSLPFSNASLVAETSFSCPFLFNFSRLPPQFLVQLLDSCEQLHLLPLVVLKFRKRSVSFLRADTLDYTNSTRFLCSAMFSSTSRWSQSVRRRFDAASDLS